jgi:hypothetical protein
MEEVKNTSGQNLGIAALITAIITFVLAVIPCVGLIALVPGIIAIILASVGLSQAARSNGPKGLQLAGLIIAVIASMISVSQIFVATEIAKKADKWPDEITNIVKDVQDDVIKDLEDENISIKIETNGNKVEINATTKDKERKLEELEGADTVKVDTLKKDKKNVPLQKK